MYLVLVYFRFCWSSIKRACWTIRTGRRLLTRNKRCIGSRGGRRAQGLLGRSVVF